MTYIADETSEQNGAPIELYEFARVTYPAPSDCDGTPAQLVIYRYTSSEADFTLSGKLYPSDQISRSPIEATPELPRSNINLTTRRNLPIADLYRVFPPSDVVTLTIKRVHRGSPTDAAVIWAGRVLNVAFNGARALISCEPVSTSLRRTGLRRMYQAQCPHVLYGPGCNLDRTTQAQSVSVVAVSGVSLQVGAMATKPYGGGFVDWEQSQGVIERRFIMAFTGSTLSLSQPFNGISPGDPVTVYPGCDHTMATCDDVYANLDNYGGFPFIPFKNPFGGTSVY